MGPGMVASVTDSPAPTVYTVLARSARSHSRMLIIAVGGAIIACLGGLKAPADRQLLATYGDQSRDLVGLWRRVLDFDHTYVPTAARSLVRR